MADAPADDDEDLGIVGFVLWRLVAAVVLGLVLTILLAVSSMGWAIGHGGYVLVWPACSFLALIALVLFPFYKVRDSLKSWRSRRAAGG